MVREIVYKIGVLSLNNVHVIIHDFEGKFIVEKIGRIFKTTIVESGLKNIL